MSYELNQLLQRYGLQAPTNVYGGSQKPAIPTLPGADASTTQLQDYNKLVEDYNKNMPIYLADQAAYEPYKQQYQQRLGAVPMYGSAQYQTKSPFNQTASQQSLLAQPQYGQAGNQPFTPLQTLTVPTQSAPAPLGVQSHGGGDGYTAGSTGSFTGDPNSLTGGLVGAMFGQDPTNVGVDYSNDAPGLAGYGMGYGPADLGSFGAGTGGFGTGPGEGPSTSTGFGGVGMDSGVSGVGTGSLGGDPGPSGTGNTGNDAEGGGGPDGPSDGFSKGGLLKLARKHKVNFADGGLNDMTENYGLRSGAVPESQLGLDLSKVTPEQMRVIMAEDPAAVQRGAERFTQYTGIPQAVPQSAQPAPSGIEALLTRYMGGDAGDTTYRDELATARQQASRETQAFNDLITKAMEQKTEGPSQAEKYFRLAAAFGAPTRTGHFMESVGKVGEVLSDTAKQEREARMADAANRLKLGITGQQARMEAAKTDLTNLRQLAGEEMKDRRTMATELVKQQLAAGKPQSEAGKKAMDMGLAPGTPQYQQFVTKYVEDQLQSGNMFKEAMLAISQQGLQLRQQAEQRQAEAAKKLTPSELKLKTETEDALAATGNVVNDLKEAYRLNPTTFDNSLPDLAMRKSLEAIGSTDPKVVNTRLQENLLTGQALAGLRAAFGGNPTEGERAILLQVQGIGSKSRKERAAIIKRAYTLAKAAKERQAKRLQDINAGAYRQTEPTTTETGGLE